MAKTFNILVFFVSIICFSQNKDLTKVTYKIVLNFDITVNSKAELFFTKANSLYTEGEFINFEEINNVKIDDTNSIKFEKIFYSNLIDNLLLTKDKLNNEIILLKEEIPKINWKIFEKEEKIILSYNCIKAQGEFRGRIYTVWFAPKIPVKHGPWKLQGLPGLILKVEDNFSEVFFTAENIELLEQNNLNIIIDKKSLKNITLKEYVNSLNDDITDKVQKLLSKMPRGSKVKNLKMKKYKGLELEYEWEKNEKDN